MQLVNFSLVRSFGEFNFTLSCQALNDLLPDFFANNNVKYAHWLLVLLREMFSLKQTNLKIFDEFLKFTVYKTHRVFSGSAIGHAREQANAVVKGDGGTIRILINLF